jgi:hypothetical protein
MPDQGNLRWPQRSGYNAMMQKHRFSRGSEQRNINYMKKKIL